MKKGKEDMHEGGCCNGSSGYFGWIVLVVAVLFLIRDLTQWAFWNINGWTVILFIIAVGLLTWKKGCCT